MAKGKARAVEDNYVVGYGKPPKEHRFQKGQVNNPNGARGKKSKNQRKQDVRAQMEKVWREALSKEVSVVVGGETKKMPALAVVVERIVNGAMKADAAMVRELRFTMKEFPQLFQAPFDITAIEYVVVTPNPFRCETATIQKFLQVFPDAPETDLEVFRRYFPKDKAEFESSGRAALVKVGAEIVPLPR